MDCKPKIKPPTVVKANSTITANGKFRLIDEPMSANNKPAEAANASDWMWYFSNKASPARSELSNIRSLNWIKSQLTRAALQATSTRIRDKPIVIPIAARSTDANNKIDADQNADLLLTYNQNRKIARSTGMIGQNPAMIYPAVKHPFEITREVARSIECAFICLSKYCYYETYG